MIPNPKERNGPPGDQFGLPGFYLPDAQAEPLPPYQVRNGADIYIVYQLTDAQAASLLPPDLKFHSGRSATLAFYTGPNGWGIAPFACFVFGLDVEGFDSADGSPAVYQVAGTYSGKAGVVFPRDFNALFHAGDVTFEVTETEMRAVAPVEGGVGTISVTALRGPEANSSNAGVLNLLGPGRDGELILHNLAFSFNFTIGTITDLRFDLPQGHPLAVLADLTPSWCLCMTDKALTFGPPGPARGGDLALGYASPFLDILSRMGRALAIVEDTGRILFLTGEAEAVLHRKTAPRLLPVELRTLLSGTDPTKSENPGFARSALLTLPHGPQVLATVFPVALRLSEAPALMVLLNDPRAPGPADPEPLLRLMGLTPSEAALAALIGKGSTPAEAAAVRGITQSTARSTLKIIFSKLGLRRQAELAQIVTRLQMG